MAERILYSLNTKAPFFVLSHLKLRLVSIVPFIWLSALHFCVLWSPVHNFREKAFKDSVQGFRLSFTMEAPEEAGRNPLLSPSSSRDLGASPDIRQALLGPYLPLFPKHFPLASPCCSWEHSAAWNAGTACVLSHVQGIANHQRPHCPWGRGIKGGEADEEIIQRGSLAPVLCKGIKQSRGEVLCLQKAN